MGRREQPAGLRGAREAYAGEFATSAESTLDEVTVLLPGVDGGVNRFGPASWMPRVDDAGETVYPTRGDACLVMFDDDGDPWVVAWREF